jgi:hypothetical protein
MKLLLYKPMGWRWFKMLLVEAVAGVVATDFIVTVEVAAVAVYKTAAHAVKVN